MKYDLSCCGMGWCGLVSCVFQFRVLFLLFCVTYYFMSCCVKFFCVMFSCGVLRCGVCVMSCFVLSFVIRSVVCCALMCCVEL